MALPIPSQLDWQIQDYLRVFRLHMGVVVLSGVLCGGFAALHVSQQPNIYQATTRILLQVQAPRFVQFQEVNPYAEPWDRSFIMTEYRVITSRHLMERVVQDLNLAAFPPFLDSGDPAALLADMLKVEIVRGTQLIDISCEGPKPELVARISNAVADTYARQNLERRQEMTTGGVQWLQEEVAKMEQKVKAAQLALQQFREENRDLPVGEEERAVAQQRFEQLSALVTDVRKQRIEAETKYRERHPILQELKSKEGELQRTMLDQERRVLEINRAAIQYDTLLREAKTSEQIYNVLLNRQKELIVEEGLQTNNVKVLDYARPPKHPIRPNRPRAIVVSALFGILLGGIAAFLREAFAQTFRIRREVERILEIPFLGHLPALRLSGGPGGAIFLDGAHPTAAEAVRSIRTTLEFILPAEQPHTLLLTSSLPKEGKSLVSLNLAIAFQELGRQVVLIDADLRRPSVHRALQMERGPGLSEYLQGKVAPEEILQIAEQANGLHVVTAGATPDQPSDLLTSPRLRELLNLWRDKYGYILFDSPPVLAVADSTALATQMDGVVFLVRAGRTYRDIALAGKQRLLDVGAKIIGVILNAARLELEQAYRYYYYYYGGERNRRKSRTPPADKAPPERSGPLT